MLTALFIVALAIVLFLCLYLGFRTGLRLGMNTAKGITPPPLRNPVQVIQEVRDSAEQSKASKAYTEGLNNIMSYTGDLPKGE